MVTIESKSWVDGIWHLNVTIVNGVGTRQGPHQIEGPKTLTDEELKEAILALY